MLGLAVAGAGAVAIALIWHKMVVPFDRMRELSEELSDSGYKLTVWRARIGEQKALMDAIRSRSRRQHNAA
jgi:hypothetical protein